MAYVSPSPDQVVTSQSSTALLAANAQFIGNPPADCTLSNISSITVFCFANKKSAVDGLQLQWSTDGSNWDHNQKTTVFPNASGIISDKVRARYFRVVYINGSEDQGTFRLQTLASSTNTSGTIRDLDTIVYDDDEAQLVRAVLTGKANTSKLISTYTDVLTDVYGSLQIVVGGQAADAFGRIRIANPTGLFDTQFQYDTQPLLFQTSAVGTGTVIKTANESSLTLSTGGTASGASAINQTKAYMRYEPGKSQQIIMTGLLGVKKANVRSRIGYFDTNDGVYFEMDGTLGASVNQRSSTSGSPVNTSILQANWNFDPMDGSGPSGVTLDWSKTQVFAMDMQWLGVGRVRFGFFVNGTLLIAHEIENANTIASPYMNTANLPCRAEITNTGVAATATIMKQVCMTVISEGGVDHPQAYQFSASNGATLISGIGGAPRTPLVSIRPKLTFGGLQNREKVNFVEFDLYNNSAIGGFWELIYNGTLTGPTAFASVDSNSGMNFDIASTGCTGGLVIASGYATPGKITNTISIDMKLPITIDITGAVADTLSLCVTSLSTNIACTGAFRWQEVR